MFTIGQMKIYKKFNQALRWNTLEVAIYQVALYIHNIAIAKVLNIKFFGAIGTVFSLIFLSIPILGFGFDKALIANFKGITANKESFKKFFLGQLFLQLIFFGLALPLFIIFENPLDIVFCKPQDCILIQKQIWAIVGLSVLSEGIRRSLKLLIQLTFKSKYTSIIETALLAAYIATVWSAYFMFGTLTLNLIFIPFLILSMLSLVIYAFICTRLYNSIKGGATHLNWPQIVKSRYEGYLFQLSSALFSGNLLVLLFAYKYGLVNAGYLKLFGYLGGIIIAFSEKIFGMAGGALFVNLKDNPEEIKKAFKKIKNQFLLILTLISVIITFIYLFSSHPIYSGSGILFLLALTLENFNVIYEKYFLIQHQILGIFFVNLACALIFFSLLYFNNLSLERTIASLILIRAVSFAIIAKKATTLK
jgi:hypothetical protein